jgi:ferredoxin
VKSLEVFYGRGKVKESHLHFFGPEGLKELAESIIRDEASMKFHSPSDDTASSVITVRFKIPHHNTEFDLPWYYNTINADGQTSSLLDLRHASSDGTALLAEYIEASCGGNCSCSTCHVYIDTSVAATDTDSTQSIELSRVTEAEQDMLDLAYQPNEKSRLACQVRLVNIQPNLESSKIPQIIVTIPSGVNDMWK